MSEAGRRQAEALRLRLQDEEYTPTHIYASPLSRAAATAAIVARDWRMSITHWDDLMEYDVGILSGLTAEEAMRKHPHIDMDAEFQRQFSGIPGAEPLADRRQRAVRVVNALIAKHGNGDSVLVVSHGGFIQQLVAAFMAAGRTWGFGIHNTALFDFSIDLDRWRDDGETRLNTTFFRIERFNDAAHLGGLQV